MTFDQFIASLAIWREARGCSLAAMTGVWWVIQNRANDVAKRWPTTIAEVVTEPWQFSSFNATDPNAVLIPTRNNSVEYAAFLNCMLVVSSPLGGDPTSGANSYHSVPSSKPQPTWADPTKHTVDIGPFKFFKL